MLLGVVSDTHNRVDNVEKIIDIFNLNKADLVIHTGDITQARTLERFSRLSSPLVGVYGNNDLEEAGLKETCLENNFEFHPPPLVKEIRGKKILVLHEPNTIDELIKNDPTIDLVIHGHTHRYVNTIKNGVRVINPGESAGILKGKNSVGLLRLKDLSFERIFF